MPPKRHLQRWPRGHQVLPWSRDPAHFHSLSGFGLRDQQYSCLTIQMGELRPRDRWSWGLNWSLLPPSDFQNLKSAPLAQGDVWGLVSYLRCPQLCTCLFGWNEFGVGEDSAGMTLMTCPGVHTNIGELQLLSPIHHHDQAE